MCVMCMELQNKSNNTHILCRMVLSYFIFDFRPIVKWKRDPLTDFQHEPYFRHCHKSQFSLDQKKIHNSMLIPV